MGWVPMKSLCHRHWGISPWRWTHLCSHESWTDVYGVGVPYEQGGLQYWVQIVFVFPLAAMLYDSVWLEWNNTNKNTDSFGYAVALCYECAKPAWSHSHSPVLSQTRFASNLAGFSKILLRLPVPWECHHVNIYTFISQLSRCQKGQLVKHSNLS